MKTPEEIAKEMFQHWAMRAEKTVTFEATDVKRLIEAIAAAIRAEQVTGEEKPPYSDPYWETHCHMCERPIRFEGNKVIPVELPAQPAARGLSEEESMSAYRAQFPSTKSDMATLHAWASCYRWLRARVLGGEGT